ncbi:MAG: alpha/beta hydrolase [Methylobacteriaceae bacterium]|nr:alpha/beta hydrolase [Methylobacteriaceae bacterium]
MSDVKTIRVNDYDTAYVEAGKGEPLVLVHGSLCDYRYWTLQLPAFSAAFRTISVSLRHYYPERWDGQGDDFSITQHMRDVVALIDALGIAPAHVVGHSRGGHIAFRIAQNYPDRVRKLVLSEPGGALDPNLSPHAAEVNKRFEPGSFQTQAEARIRAGDIDGGLQIFVDAVSGPGAWERTPPLAKQFTRDNAITLLGQIHETREPFRREAAQAIKAPTLLVLGGLSPPMFGLIIDALAAAIPKAQCVTIADATHTMNVIKPAAYNEAVLNFLRA